MSRNSSVVKSLDMMFAISPTFASMFALLQINLPIFVSWVKICTLELDARPGSFSTGIALRLINNRNEHKMDNEWNFDDSPKAEVRVVKPSARGNAHQERDRRTKSIEIVSMFKAKLDSMYTPVIAKEHPPALMRQKGVPSLDWVTKSIISSFRSGLGCSPDVEGTLRKLLALSRWSTLDTSMTLWTTEPVASSVIISGNSIDVATAKENFCRDPDVIDPLTMTTHTPSIRGNQIMGRRAGWLVWR
ncbi:hypothetical protein DL768_011113 [Monosporascus sp. mg162]|nr:hypothetical protein DL768_011113 [Monosporascus sp. mg162]